MPGRAAIEAALAAEGRSPAQSDLAEMDALWDAAKAADLYFLAGFRQVRRVSFGDKGVEQLAPFDPSPERYHHNRTGEDNADTHHKRQIMGREVVVAVTDGRLDLGPWEQIFYGEFDGKHRKRVLVKIIGE